MSHLGDVLVELGPIAQDYVVTPGLSSDMRWVRAADLNSLRDELIDLRRAAALLPSALAIIDSLVDPDPCWYDHGGKCQAHGPGSEGRCPDALAQEFLRQHGMTTGSSASEGNAP